jgi:hypothetical protein
VDILQNKTDSVSVEMVDPDTSKLPGGKIRLDMVQYTESRLPTRNASKLFKSIIKYNS